MEPKEVESFDCFVQAAEGGELELRTWSSEGEEAVAVMPISSLPQDDRSRVKAGDALRISIIRLSDGRLDYCIKFFPLGGSTS